MQIDEKLVQYLERLGRIELSADERAACEQDLQKILDYIDTLEQLDTEGVEPASHSFPVANVVREDEVTNTARQGEMLQNAPDSRDGSFAVPKTVE
ncbi:MAG TPA: Asp-tRNA(Asn)/Glu-tRNA(Gln) amidotransferase subunit GatC [Candidatus Fimenecus excrementigallinarum]|uniref:Aspartyl/glutamyl-tRNA(Asn/Gln) amidotransferase subunit C n=1 Tax=Candidatus Fimenecus excrementigallinarum TaxID=2840816 RepID=A0A9D1ID75_9FIRM|nr:Asp-tRNA(Asn)/Glu-tRNA(Gln) amidotransferase subunit GatC [Candidatus Fimenecus excrementigallinarum]